MTENMKNVCGTCIFGIDSEAGQSCINVLCAFDNEWRPDHTEGCTRWKEATGGLSKKDRINLANKLIEQERVERRHQEVIQESRVERKTQFKLLILGFLLGIIGTLLSQWIWSLCTK